MDYTNLSAEDLAALATERRGAFDVLIALETAPTVAQVDEAEALAAEIEAITAEVTNRETAAAEAADRFAALQTRFAEQPPEPEPVEDEVEEVVEEEPEPVPVARANVTQLAARTTRPSTPTRVNGTLSITAAADVPGFAASSTLDGVTQIGEAIVNRMRGFTPPSGDGRTENLQKFGVASFHRPFENELTIDRGSDDMETLSYAAKESRLPGNSLVAAGGWCSPSETIYDLCSGETLEGILSVAEVNVKRGGINFTRGPDFADFYTDADGFFVQTEAQAIAGATKPCVTVDCPAFTDVRLDATGLCIKIPILTNAAYPELVQRYVSGYLTAYEHRMNAAVIARIVALTGAARVIVGIGSSVQDSLAGLTLIADQRRQQRRLSMTHSFEVVVPFWLKNVYRNDLAIRTGRDSGAVTDAELTSYFSARNLAVSYVYDWQDLDITAEVYPATYNVLMYPAGTFIKGTTDVINLSAVYDAASLATNVYTGLFMEEGLLVAKMCNDSDLVTLPICSAGRTGAANLTCA